jgi:hypothetical protein
MSLIPFAPFFALFYEDLSSFYARPHSIRVQSEVGTIGKLTPG